MYDAGIEDKSFLQFSVYIVRQEKAKLPKKNALILVKYFFIEEKNKCSYRLPSSKFIGMLDNVIFSMKIF